MPPLIQPHPLVTLIAEAREERDKVSVRWIDNGGPDHDGAWYVEVGDFVDEDERGEDADLTSAAQQALERYRELIEAYS